MSEKKKRMAAASMLFESRPKVGGKKLYPLTAGRMVILEERKNPLVGSMTKGEEVSGQAVFELMMVCALEPRELAKIARLEAGDWDEEVSVFGMEVAQGDLIDFWNVVEAEFEAMRSARAVPKKKRARRV
jgi:hypothetical protein|tara:strand:- start:8673 stop:9062 length:390 start_codon:yes stop_codon:yes gene_type:complete